VLHLFGQLLIQISDARNHKHKSPYQFIHYNICNLLYIRSTNIEPPQTCPKERLTLFVSFKANSQKFQKVLRNEEVQGNLKTEYIYVFSIMLRLFHLFENNFKRPLEKRLGGPRANRDAAPKMKIRLLSVIAQRLRNPQPVSFT